MDDNLWENNTGIVAKRQPQVVQVSRCTKFKYTRYSYSTYLVVIPVSIRICMNKRKYHISTLLDPLIYVYTCRKNDVLIAGVLDAVSCVMRLCGDR